MFVKNITNKSTPKPIGIGTIILMPGESEEIPDELAYVDEFDKMGKKTGKKIILPALDAMVRLGLMEYTETKKPAAKKAVNVEEEPVVEEVVEKPKRSRKKVAEAE